jgi:hypothetical protein
MSAGPSGPRGNVGYQMGMDNNAWQQQLGGQPQLGAQSPSPWQMGVTPPSMQGSNGNNQGAALLGGPIPSQGQAPTLGDQPGYDRAPPPGYQQPPSGSAATLPQQRVIQPQPGQGVMQSPPSAGSGMRQFLPRQPVRGGGTWGY